ncbi:hypothetical protein ABK040_016585 [Willaertia magna]
MMSKDRTLTSEEIMEDDDENEGLGLEIVEETEEMKQFVEAIAMFSNLPQNQNHPTRSKATTVAGNNNNKEEEENSNSTSTNSNNNNNNNKASSNNTYDVPIRKRPWKATNSNNNASPTTITPEIRLQPVEPSVNVEPTTTMAITTMNNSRTTLQIPSISPIKINNNNKKAVVIYNNNGGETSTHTPSSAKRKRGRPRKNNALDMSTTPTTPLTNGGSGSSSQLYSPVENKKVKLLSNNNNIGGNNNFLLASGISENLLNKAYIEIFPVMKVSTLELDFHFLSTKVDSYLTKDVISVLNKANHEFLVDCKYLNQECSIDSVDCSKLLSNNRK